MAKVDSGKPVVRTISPLTSMERTCYNKSNIDYVRRNTAIRDIILDEKATAEAVLAGKAKLEDVRSLIFLLVRYDVQVVGLDPNAAKDHVYQVARSLFPKIRPNYYEKYLEYCKNHAAERSLHYFNGVPITQAELDYIMTRDGIRAKCLAFAALAMAKYNTMRYPAAKYWIHQDRWGEMMKRANLTLSEDDMCNILGGMIKDGKMAIPKRIDSYSIQVLFADETGAPVMMLNDMDYRDLGYCLRAYLGELYVRCEECGRWIRQAKNGRRRFCDDCAADSHKRNALASYHRRK